MDKKSIVKGLDHLSTWVASREGARSNRDHADDAVNILTGCFFVCCYECGKKEIDMTNWLDRKRGRRAALKRVRISYREKRGQKALLSLIDLTISEVQACACKKDLLTGALPIKDSQRKLSEEHKRALQGGRDRARRERGARRQERVQYEPPDRVKMGKAEARSEAVRIAWV